MKILVTGGAGFIGSNLVKHLLQLSTVSKVRVLDNLATGTLKNIEEFEQNEKFEFLQGDIREYETCLVACEGIDLISHQAALGSVPRSINDPLTTNNVNITGTLNIFTAAKDKGVKRVVYAASSSTYGDHPALPKVEDKIGNPLSPYAVTKYVNELYAKVYGSVYGLESIGLRYFNVFGPNQNPQGAYAAVIPLFIKAVLDNEPPLINGDGEHSRDFTFVENAVQINVKGMLSENAEAVGKVYNVAVGESYSVNYLYNACRQYLGSDWQPTYREPRAGDIRNSLADIALAQNLLGYKPVKRFDDGLETTIEYFKNLYG